MPRFKYHRASIPVWCTALYVGLAASASIGALVLLEGPTTACATLMVCAIALLVITLTSDELAMEGKALNIVTVALLSSTAVLAAPHLSEGLHLTLAGATALVSIGLLLKVAPGDHEDWGDHSDLLDMGGYVAAPWIAHALWASRATLSLALVACIGGAVSRGIEGQWQTMPIYLAMAALILVACNLQRLLERWLIADQWKTEATVSPVPPAESNLTPRS